MPILLNSTEELHTFNKEYANTVPQPSNPAELLDNLNSLHRRLVSHWTSSQPPTATSTALISAASILLRCSSLPSTCPFHTQLAIRNLLSSIATHTECTECNITQVKLLFNILKTWSSAAAFEAIVAGTTSEDNNAGQDGATILTILFQRPMSAAHARLVCIILERFIVLVPGFVSVPLAPAPETNTAVLPGLPGLPGIPETSGTSVAVPAPSTLKTSTVQLSKLVVAMLTKVVRGSSTTVVLPFPHGQGRVELCIHLWNLLFALITIESKMTSNAEIQVAGMLPVVQEMLTFPDSPDRQVFRAQCSAITVLLNSRQSLCDLCRNSPNNGHILFSALLNICEKWLIIYYIEKRDKKHMDATLLPCVLILLRAMEDVPQTIGTLVQQRLQECDYIRDCIKCSMNSFESTSKVSIAMGDLVLLMCQNKPNVLIQYVGTGAAMGVLQRKGFLKK